MATQTIRVHAPLPSGTYTANVQLDGSNTNAFADRPLTNTGNPAFWAFTVSNASGGLYSFQIFDVDTNMVAWGYFYSAVNSVVTIQDSNTREDALILAKFGDPAGASMAADIATLQETLDKVPRVGKTHRFSRASAGTLEADIAISETP